MSLGTAAGQVARHGHLRARPVLGDQPLYTRAKRLKGPRHPRRQATRETCWLVSRPGPEPVLIVSFPHSQGALLLVRSTQGRPLMSSDCAKSPNLAGFPSTRRNSAHLIMHPRSNRPQRVADWQISNQGPRAAEPICRQGESPSHSQSRRRNSADNETLRSIFDRSDQHFLCVPSES